MTRHKRGEVLKIEKNNEIIDESTQQWQEAFKPEWGQWASNCIDFAFISLEWNQWNEERSKISKNFCWVFDLFISLCSSPSFELYIHRNAKIIFGLRELRVDRISDFFSVEFLAQFSPQLFEQSNTALIVVLEITRPKVNRNFSWGGLRCGAVVADEYRQIA